MILMPVTDGKNFASRYHNILCKEWPDFLDKYISLPMMQRLEEVGLLCGTDWTPLYNNRFYYSRLDHSIGVALIIWNFTHSKKQTLAGLFHDVSTPAFSHVTDFRNGDALKQESTEDLNARMIEEDGMLIDILKHEGYYAYEVKDYHKFPIADNEMPGLSSDRLEYMYPSGAALDEIWNLDDIARSYENIKVLCNEKGADELGFKDKEAAFDYMSRFIDISLILQRNEDKLVMQLLGDIVDKAIALSVIEEDDLYTLGEQELMTLFEIKAETNIDPEFTRMFNTFRGMKSILHTDKPVDNAYCVSLDVKQRYVDPLVETSDGSVRISQLDKRAKDKIQSFLNYKDTKYGCAPWIDA